MPRGEGAPNRPGADEPPHRPFRVGVIGAGYVARGAHLPGWAAVPGVEIAAVCDPDPDALALAAPLALKARLLTDHREMLAEDLDAVSICAPGAAHFGLARDALRAGLHVLCEKPLCVTAAEAEALGREADARGRVLMTRHQLRFDAPARLARGRVRAGDLGRIHHVRARALRRDRIPTTPGLTDAALAGGGAALDLGVHALDMALWLMDFPPEHGARVSGTARTVFGRAGGIPGHWGDWDHDRFSVEDFAAGLVHFGNGITLTFEFAWAGHYAEEGLDCALFGDKGSLHWPTGEFVSQGPMLHRESPAIPGTGIVPPPDLLAFYEACRTGGSSPVPWQEAATSLRIIEALYRSAREGREVRIEE
jgi:predicted dehydrogenase